MKIGNILLPFLVLTMVLSSNLARGSEDEEIIALKGEGVIAEGKSVTPVLDAQTKYDTLINIYKTYIVKNRNKALTALSDATAIAIQSRKFKEFGRVKTDDEVNHMVFIKPKNLGYMMLVYYDFETGQYLLTPEQLKKLNDL